MTVALKVSGELTDVIPGLEEALEGVEANQAKFTPMQAAKCPQTAS